MNTEITEYKKETWEHEWVGYDAHCPLCRRSVEWLRPILEPRGFTFVPLQTPWVCRRLGLDPGERPKEMVMMTRDGKAVGGGVAVRYLAGRVWWAAPIVWLGWLPGGARVVDAIYRRVAERRTCDGGACAVERERHWSGWLLFLVLPLLTGWLLWHEPAWVLMWGLAAALYAGAKWLVWWPVRRAMHTRAALAFLFLWVGMDPKPFCGPVETRLRITMGAGLAAFGKTLLGCGLLWMAARWVPAGHELLRGWVGMLGIIFALHFGLFHLLALAWNLAGIPVRPLMYWPIAATSLAEFWGVRWNTGFHDLAFRHLFRPVAARASAPLALLVTYLASGLIHDLVISVPAHAGYGLPTLYFLLQGLGVLAERTPLARRLGFGRGFRGWCFTVLVAALPVGLLFHPGFVRNVILPMLQTIGAT